MSEKALSYLDLFNQLLVLFVVSSCLVLIDVAGIRKFLYNMAYAITHAVEAWLERFDPDLQSSWNVGCDMDACPQFVPLPTGKDDTGRLQGGVLKQEAGVKQPWGDLAEFCKLQGSIIQLQDRVASLEKHKFTSMDDTLLKCFQNLLAEVRGQPPACTGELCCGSSLIQAELADQAKAISAMNSHVDRLSVEVNQLQHTITIRDNLITTLQGKLTKHEFEEMELGGHQGLLDHVSFPKTYIPATDPLEPKQLHVHPSDQAMTLPIDRVVARADITACTRPVPPCSSPPSAPSQFEFDSHKMTHEPQRFLAKTLDDDDLMILAEHIDRFNPPVSGSADTHAYLDSIEDCLRSHEPVTVETKVRLIHLTSNREVFSCLTRQPAQFLQDWGSVRQVIIDEFSDDCGVQPGLVSAMGVKQLYGEGVDVFYRRLMKAFFGYKNTPNMEEDVMFKQLFVNNLLPSVTRRFPLDVRLSSNMATCPKSIRELRSLAREAFARDRDDPPLSFSSQRSHKSPEVSHEVRESRRQRKARLYAARQKSGPSDNDWRASMHD